MLRTTALSLMAALAVAVPLAPATPAGAAVDPGTGTTYATGTTVVPMVFPVVGPTSYSDNFLACRSGCSRMHMGQDLMGPKMSPLVATFDGVVTTLKRDGSSGNYVGITATAGPAAGWTALYLHVNNDTPGTDDGRGTQDFAFPSGIEVGSRVVAGQLIGWRGDSGNSEGTAPHLHFELRKGEGWGGVVFNAYPSLRAAQRLTAPRPSGPHPSGTLVRPPDGATFLLEGTTKRPLSRAVMAANGHVDATVVRITAREAAGYATGERVTPREGTVVRDPRGSTWVVSGGHRVRAELTALLDPLARVSPVGYADLVGLPVAEGGLRDAAAALRGLLEGVLLEGQLLRVGQGAVHRVEGGVLRPFLAGAAATWGLRATDVATVPALPDLPVGDPVGLRDGTLAWVPGDVLGVVSDGRLHVLHDTRQIRDYGYAGRPRTRVAAEAVAGMDRVELSADPSRLEREWWR